MRDDAPEEHLLLRGVDRLDGLQQLRPGARLRCGPLQRLHILREAGPSVARARVDEGIADACIRADPLPYLLDVGPDLLGDSGQFVDERDLGGEHRVGRVLRELGGSLIHHDQPVTVAREGVVEGAQNLDGTR